MNSLIKTLFLHNLNDTNKEVTLQNYNSFLQNGNEIEGILDDDLQGLENSFKVPVKKKDLIPRGSRRWNPEIVFLNYFIENKNSLTHKYYMLCEWDCYTKVNLDIFFEEYLNKYDVISPHIMTYNEDPNWQWFKNLNFPKEKLLGFRPSVFILFSKEAALSIANFYKENWNKLENSNSEALLGTVANILNLKIKSLSESIDLYNSISWFECNFKLETSILHPVKFLISENKNFYINSPNPNSQNAGNWIFGRTGFGNKFEKLNNLILNKNGTIENKPHFNENFWNDDENHINIYNYQGGLTTRFKKVTPNFYVGDFYNGAAIKDPRLNNKNFHFLKRNN
jgi:hypothetical protein